jgi:hypothetical protein
MSLRPLKMGSFEPCCFTLGVPSGFGRAAGRRPDVPWLTRGNLQSNNLTSNSTMVTKSRTL